MERVGLQVISSNRIEILQRRLSEDLLAAPLASPFEAELIIVPGSALARWLQVQMAQTNGIAANMDYSLLASAIWKLATRVLEGVPDEDPLSRDRSSWKIYHLLPDRLAEPAFASLSRYLSGDTNGVKRWQLSTQIADVFDRYQYYRPAMIERWSQGDETHWQAQLWRDLLVGEEQVHRVALLNRFTGMLRAGTNLGELPERIGLFAPTAIAPIYLNCLQTIACCLPVTVYQHSPTDQYWADLRSRKTLARMRLEKPDDAAYYDTGNELLASWGRQGQALQDLLLGEDAGQLHQIDAYNEPVADTLLHRVQDQLFLLNDVAVSVEMDDSIEVAVCHSELRECQVLHDRLLAMFDESDQLMPEDILVMVPDISRYAPSIEAVFHASEFTARPYIPWNLSDTVIADEHPLIRTFFKLLSLPSSRFNWSELMYLMDVGELLARFNLNDDDVKQIRIFLERASVRWGIDGEHKEGLGLPGTMGNTWKQAMARLMSGYALGEVDQWQGLAPISGVEGGAAESIGRFWMMFDRLLFWRNELSKERPFSEWQTQLNRLLADFFAEDTDEDGKQQQIRDAIDDLAMLASSETMTLDLVYRCLDDRLGRTTMAQAYFSGGVTFCGMQPMRSLPFQVICLLGMNEADFPRREHPIEFDLMAKNWQQGDPRKGDADRYLLLETLLCARQKLYISYVGRSLSDNSECQPSVLVREFLDYLDTHFTLQGDASEPLSVGVSRLWPMQPFSPRNYRKTTGVESNGKTPGVSYDRYWCEIADQLQRSTRAESDRCWPQIGLAAPDEAQQAIDFQALARFYRHPIKAFFNSRLRLWLESEETVEDTEPFELDALENWSIKATMAEASLLGEGLALDQLVARGFLPHGGMASLEFERLRRDTQPLMTRLMPFKETVAEPGLIDLALDDSCHLSGQVSRYRPGAGLLHFTPSKFDGRALIGVWLEHLVLSASGQLAKGETSLLICSDEAMRFDPVESDRAMTLLSGYVQIYRQGLVRPLPLFAKTSCAFIQHGLGGSNGARGRWQASSWSGAVPREADDPYIRLAMRGLVVDPLVDSEFMDLAEFTYGDALRQGELL